MSGKYNAPTSPPRKAQLNCVPIISIDRCICGQWVAANTYPMQDARDFRGHLQSNVIYSMGTQVLLTIRCHRRPLYLRHDRFYNLQTTFSDEISPDGQKVYYSSK